MKLKLFRQAMRDIRKLCSKMLGYNSVRQVLSLKTPDGVIRTAIEAVIHEKAGDIGRAYLSEPKILKTIKNIQSCENVLEYMFSVLHNGERENYFVCLCSSKPRLGTYQPADKLIINLH